MLKRRLFTIFAIVFVDLLGFSLVIPLIPFYAADFGASKPMQGMLIAAYSIAQFIGAPLLGQWSDKLGRRPVLLVSIFGSAIGFALLGIANTLPLLFFSRILDGATGGNISVAQSYITDVTDEESRAMGLGLIGAAFGMGFIFGPALGGFLSGIGQANIELWGLDWKYALPAAFATTLALINVVAVYFFLPETLSAEQRANSTRKTFGQSMGALWQILFRPKVGSFVITRFGFGMSFGFLQSVFAIYSAARFGLDQVQTGYLLAYVGVLIVIVQGILIRRITAAFDEFKLVLFAATTMAIGLILWGFAPSVPLLLVILIPIAAAAGIFNTVINSTLTKIVEPREVGEILGLATGWESVTRIFAPILGALLIEYLGTWGPGLIGGLILFGLLPYIYTRIVKPMTQTKTPSTG